jgi:peptide/nickel transport system permease protein
MTNPPDFTVTSGGAVAFGPIAVSRKSPSRLFWDRFRQDRLALAGGVIVILLIVIAIIGGPIASHITGHPQNQPYPNTMEDQFGIPKGPNSSFWFGADASGRDLFVRVMYGARTSLIVGIGASAIAVLIGLVVGLLAGFYGGWVDTLLSRAADVMLSLPQILIAVGVVAACSLGNGCLGGLLQPGLPIVIAVIAFFSWSYIARIVRGYTLSLREKEFVESARALGATNRRIIVSEIIPNLIGPLLVYTTLLIPTNILFEAALSFLGLGVPVTTSSWGSTLADATQLYDVAWWLMVFPGGFLILTTLAFNLLGDGLRDAFDVRSER